MSIIKYNLSSLLSEFCNEIEIIESDNFCDSIMEYVVTEKQKEKIMLCKSQFEYIDATVVIPQTITLMYGKEASNQKQEIDRQHHTIPNQRSQRPKDKHYAHSHECLRL